MDSTVILRSTILSALKKDKAFGSVVAAEAKKGAHFSETDIALTDKNNETEVYRMILVKRV